MDFSIWYRIKDLPFLTGIEVSSETKWDGKAQITGLAITVDSGETNQDSYPVSASIFLDTDQEEQLRQYLNARYEAKQA